MARLTTKHQKKMARGLNKVVLIGRIGKDPETRQAGTSSVCQFSVATSEKFKDQQGQQQERTEWHNIVAWGRLGEICQQYLRKGAEVYIEGKIQTRSWEKDGVKQYRTEIVASDMQMFGSSGQPQRTEAAAAPVAQAAKPEPVDDLPF